MEREDEPMQGGEMEKEVNRARGSQNKEVGMGKVEKGVN